jgi:ABC-type uncharacterized transport system permease subunit
MYGIYIFLLLLLLGANAVYPKKPFNIHLSGLLYGIPVVLFIVIFIVVIGYLTKSLSSGCLMLLFLTLILAYAGGLLIPEAMLPAFIKNLCHYTPYYKLNQMICYGLYH